MQTANTKESLLAQARQSAPEITEIRRKIHQSPETGTHLPQTADLVTDRLKAYGYRPKRIGDSGIAADLEGARPGKTILLRADMDALPGVEQSDCEFRSKNGRMHACGHDMHTAMLLGAAKLLMDNRDRICGRVRLVFQPDEEGFTGAKSMLEEGILKHPAVDAGLALHVHSGTPTGMILCGKGVCMAGCTLFRIEIQGKGCHGAMPETGVDPLNIAAHIHLSLQEIVAREISGLTPAVVTIGKLIGGEAPNMIPQRVIMEGSIRTADKAVARQIFDRICAISEGTATLFGGSAAVSELASAPPLINDPTLSDKIAGYARELAGERSVYVHETIGMGSEDFASYTYEIPCTYLLIGAGSSDEDPRFGKPMHNPSVFFNEDILPLGAAVYSHCAIRWLEDNA